MGRYKQRGVVVRELRTGISIYFIDRQTITVANTDGFFYTFHCWGVEQRGYHMNNWRPFRARLRNYKKLDIYKIYRLARRFEVDTIVSVRPPQLDKEIVEKD